MPAGLGVAVLAAVAVGCGSTATVPLTTTATTTSGKTATVVSPSPTAGPTSDLLLVVWCSLRIGEPQADVLAAMGDPHGAKAGTYKIPGITSLEWDVGDTILLASFKGGVASNLQAYDGGIGPQGSSRIQCASFRNPSKPNG